MTALRNRLEDHPKHQWIVVMVVLTGIAAISFPITVLSASLPTIADDLGTSDNTITWVIVAPLVLFTGLTPIAGKLGDLYGHRRMFVLSYCVFTTLSLLTAFAWNAGALIALRTVAQASGAIAGPAGTAIMLRVFAPSERARPLGYFAAVMALSPAVGVIAGGPIVDAVGWRMLFVFQAGIASIGLLATWLLLPEDRETERVQFDLAGAATLAFGIGAALFAVNRAGSWSLTHPAIPLAAVLAVALLWWFVRIEHATSAPLLPPEYMTNPAIYRPVLAQALMQAGYMGGLVITPFFLERIYGYSATVIGLLVSPRALNFALAAAVAGRLDQRFGGRRIVISAISLVLAANLVMTAGVGVPLIGLVLVGAALSGSGNGGSRPSIMAAIANSVTDDELGVASGALNMSTQIGAATGITVFSSFIGESTSLDRWVAVFLLISAVALVALVVAMRIPQSFGGREDDGEGRPSGVAEVSTDGLVDRAGVATGYETTPSDAPDLATVTSGSREGKDPTTGTRRRRRWR